MLLGFVFGGVISICIVLLRVFLRRGIESPEQLEELGINVYASVPVAEIISKTASKKGLLRKNKMILIKVCLH